MIPKIVHFTWVDDSILTSDHIFPKHTIQKMINLSPDWSFQLSTDDDIDNYLRLKLNTADYNLIKHCHIVEKSDLWRLMKLYEEGGLYTDIDRLCNTSLNDIVVEDIKCILPTCQDNDFSQDFMCSAPRNPIYLETFKLIMHRRRAGHTNTYFLGPQTYMHGVTKALFGSIIDVGVDSELFDSLRTAIGSTQFLSTCREDPPYNTILYRPDKVQADFDHEAEKRSFYASSNLKHWTNEW